MKGIKRASRFLKQYFVFNRSERKGIYVLLFLIAISLALPRLWAVVFPPELLPIHIADLPEEEKIPAPALPVPEAVGHASIRMFNFDPNKADSLTLVQLGFSPKTARSMINYRNKGGHLKKAEDLYRIYRVDSLLVTRLIPYVQIEEQAEKQYKQGNIDYVKTERKPVEMNTADSVSLVKLYGIGPKMAARIIEYRTRSGGFFTLEQLHEIYGFDEGLLEELIGRIYVDPLQVRYININTVSFETLKQHPYLRYKTANAIINYRNQHGPFKDVEDLKKIVILPDSTYRKLLPYLKLAD